MTARGLRNANPGNIRLSRTAWQGEAAEQLDPDFITFQAPEWGLRAIAKILLSYQAHGLATVAQMIARWAPPVENDTDAYIAAVANAVGVNADTRIDLHNPLLMAAMVKAIVRHENGVQPYGDAQVTRGLELAGLAVAA